MVTNNGVTIGFYVRSANVTSLVQNGMNGVYALSSVPALLEALDSSTLETNHAGWTLAVVYENAALPLRNLTLWGGGAVVSLTAGSTDVFLTGFLTPETLPVSGKMFVSAQEGDAVIAGDKMLFGQNLLSLQTLSGPNNPANNFFASQINNANGTLETGGTFGGRNANAAAGTNTVACRQGWDITAADVSSLLSAGMTTAAVRFTTTGDLYVANGLALQIDSKGAQLRKDVLPIEAEIDRWAQGRLKFRIESETAPSAYVGVPAAEQTVQGGKEGSFPLFLGDTCLRLEADAQSGRVLALAGETEVAKMTQARLSLPSEAQEGVLCAEGEALQYCAGTWIPFGSEPVYDAQSGVLRLGNCEEGPLYKVLPNVWVSLGEKGELCGILCVQIGLSRSEPDR